MPRRNASPEASDPTVKLFGRSISQPQENEVLDLPPLPTSVPPPSSSPTSLLPDISLESFKAQEEPCTVVEDSDDEGGASTSECPETVSSAQLNREYVKNSEGGKASSIKKPDKILPCPRCNSMDTKFCYFNNYNVNQPRHFCRNCQRYWTAGGAIRNVPVGAGRRTNKHASSHLQPVVIPSSGGSVEVLKLNPQSLLYKSVGNKLPLEEQENLHEAFSATINSLRENEVSQAEEPSSSEGGFNAVHTRQGLPGPMPYPWNFCWNGMADGGATLNTFLVPYSPVTAMSHGVCMPTVAFSLMPAMYMGWDANTGNPSPSSCLSSASCSANSNCSGNTSPLGKHSRDLNPQEEEKSEKSLWIPKTLRIDDPEEAAKSSIWSTLGIKPGKYEPISKGGMFKAFQSRNKETAEISGTDKALQANPAALSRSNTFQESA